MQGSNIDKLKGLWRACFSDSEEFISHFFNAVFKDEYVLYEEENGIIYSALYCIPYEFKYFNTAVKASYIYAVGTLPSYRGRGAMAGLLKKAMDKLKAEGNAFAFLIPAEDSLYDLYGRNGFAEAFYCSKSIFRSGKAERKVKVIETGNDIDKVFRSFDSLQRQRTMSIMHSKEDWIFHIEDLRQDGGKAFYTESDTGEISAVAHVCEYSSEVCVKELLYKGEREKNDILNSIADYYQADHISLKDIPDKGSVCQRYGMAYMLNPKMLIAEWKRQNPDIIYSAEAIERLDGRKQTTLLLAYPEKKGYLSMMMD